MIISRFYELLGNALYALAKADGQLQEQEEDVLGKEIVKLMEQYPGFEEHAEIKKLLLTKVSFYNAVREDRNGKELLKEFEDFVKVNYQKLKPETRSIAANLLQKVATAYKGVNKMESEWMHPVLQLLRTEDESKEDENNE